MGHQPGLFSKEKVQVGHERDHSQDSSMLKGCGRLDGSHTHTLQVYLQSEGGGAVLFDHFKIK